MIKNQKIIRFNWALYSEKSVRDAAQEYEKALENKVKFAVSKDKKYTQAEITSKKVIGDDLADEFSNFVLYLNINQQVQWFQSKKTKSI